LKVKKDVLSPLLEEEKLSSEKKLKRALKALLDFKNRTKVHIEINSWRHHREFVE
jgi:hypothetical protein